jgi:hypothetical protein
MQYDSLVLDLEILVINNSNRSSFHWSPNTYVKKLTICVPTHKPLNTVSGGTLRITFRAVPSSAEQAFWLSLNIQKRNRGGSQKSMRDNKKQLRLNTMPSPLPVHLVSKKNCDVFAPKSVDGMKRNSSTRSPGIDSIGREIIIW